jgi:hypothetical protein
MILVSLAAGIVALFAAWAQAERRQEAAVLFAVGVASPLWFYAVSGWEHAPAIALSSLAFACVLRGPEGWAPFLAGLCLGAGATLRDEVLLLAPGLLLAGWMRTRTPGAVVLIVAGLLVPLGCAAGFEVLWFKRPLAAHLRHAVHLLQTALHVTDATRRWCSTGSWVTARTSGSASTCPGLPLRSRSGGGAGPLRDCSSGSPLSSAWRRSTCTSS